MLDSLHIQNYRLFKDLKIDNLRRVNLIAGKNNTGKTALLEALRILESEFDIFVINDIIRLRGEWTDIDFDKADYKDVVIKNYSTLLPYGQSLKIIEYPIESQTNFDIGNYSVKGFINFSSKGMALSVINKNIIHGKDIVGYCKETDDTLRFIPFNTGYSNLKLFDRFALTEDEDFVIEALKMIDSRITRFTLDQNQQGKVKLNGHASPVFLRTLGDGVNRMLNIIFALILSKNRAIFIDEFEVGLHHSVQQQLWEIIFEYAEKWNIQVFATTHSQDTVEKFYYVANMPQNMGKGKYFTLNRDGEDIVAVDYDMEEIKLALESNIEIR